MINAGIGSLVGVLVVTGLIYTDTQALGRLIVGDESPLIAVMLLVFGFVITFGSAAMGAAIMAVPYGDGSRRDGRRVGDGSAASAEGGRVPVMAVARR